jgi:hypothetical protein
MTTYHSFILGGALVGAGVHGGHPGGLIKLSSQETARGK